MKGVTLKFDVEHLMVTITREDGEVKNFLAPSTVFMAARRLKLGPRARYPVSEAVGPLRGTLTTEEPKPDTGWTLLCLDPEPFQGMSWSSANDPALGFNACKSAAEWGGLLDEDTKGPVAMIWAKMDEETDNVSVFPEAEPADR